MASLALNASTPITLPAGSTLFVYGTGIAVYGPGSQAGMQVGINNKGSVGPFQADRIIYLTATGTALTYNTSTSNSEEPGLRLSRSAAGDVQGVENLDGGQTDGAAAVAAALKSFVPITNDYPGVRDAALAAIAIGGYVKFEAKRYYLAINNPTNASLPIANNLGYIGAGWGIYQVGVQGAATNLPLDPGSTILDGGGVVTPFSWNTTPYTLAQANAAWGSGTTASQGAQGRDAYHGVTIRDLAFDNCPYGIWTGAQYRGSFSESILENLGFFNCANWGYWIENITLMKQIGYMHVYQSGSSHGGCWAFSTAAYDNPGNSVMEWMYSTIPMVNNIKNRGIVFLTYNATISGTPAVDTIQVNRHNQATSTQSVTVINAGASADLGVTDLSKFAVNMPVTFSSTTNGFTQNRTYFVLSMSGSTGAGTIQVANTHGNFTTGAPAGFLNDNAANPTAIIPSASNAFSITTQGFPGLEYVAIDTSKHQPVIAKNVNIEAGGTTQILVQNANFVDIEMPGNTVGSTVTSHITLRSASRTKLKILSSGIIDVDSNSTNVAYEGELKAQYGSGAYPYGCYTDVSNGIRPIVNLSYQTTAPDKASIVSDTTQTGGTLLRFNNTMVQRQQVSRTTANAINPGWDSGDINYDGAGGITVPLPTITAAQVGIPFNVVNCSTGNVAFTTDGTQLINLQAGKHTITLTPGQFAFIRGAVKSDGTTYYLSAATNGTLS